MKRRTATAFFLAVGFALSAIPAMATTTTVTEFPVLAGDVRAYPNGIHPDLGMVGVSSNLSFDHAVLWRNPSSVEVLPPASSLPAGGSNAMAIADDGTIVGNQYFAANNTTNFVAVVWNRNADGSYAEASILSIPADLKNGHAAQINGSHEIVGSAAVVGQVGQVMPVLWRPNGTTWDAEELQRLAGSSICNANDINELGVITGTCGATAVRWIPSGGTYGAPTAMPGSSANAVAINDGNVVVGAVSGNPAEWVGNQNPTLPFGKKFGGASIDVNNQSWILARKSSGSVLFLFDGTTTTNLSNLLAGTISGFSSGGVGGALTDNNGGVVLIAVSAYVRRTGFSGYVPVLIEMDL
jgi:hypothetical protein